MTTLATDKPRDTETGDLNDLPVIATDIIYEGAAVGDNGSGYARPLVAGDPFRGFALYKSDNSTGSAGDKKVRVRHHGRIVLPVTGVDGVDDVGKPVYASDDDTFTLTASTNSYIGRVIRHISSTSVVVEFDAARGQFGTLAALTAITGGEAPTEAEHNTLLAAVNSIIAMLK